MTDEEAFIRAIQAAPDDDGPRLIYADWLEEGGDSRGELLRVEVELRRLTAEEVSGQQRRLLKVRRQIALRRRLLMLVKQVAPTWRARIARTEVESCWNDFAFRCPREWARLKLTEDAKVRHCDVCQRQVYFCDNVSEARDHARQGRCVAVESTAPRQSGDIEPWQGVLVGEMLSPPAAEPAWTALRTPQAGRRQALPGDRVTVSYGPHRGEAGQVLRVFEREGRALIRLTGRGRRFARLAFDEFEREDA